MSKPERCECHPPAVAAPSGNAGATRDEWNSNRRGLLVVLAILVLTASATLFLFRAHSAWAVTAIAPGTAVTSGFEEESHFAVWRRLNDMPMYRSETRAPYASTYFNWLFYDGYAAIIARFDAAPERPVIPAVGRLLTASGALLGLLIAAVVFRAISSGQGLLGTAIAAFLFTGPLVGWWAHTVRPDVWALAFETIGLGLILGTRRRSALWVLPAAIAFFAAWSCKQTFIHAMVAAWMLLVWRKQFAHAAVLTVVAVGLMAVAWVSLGSEYQATQIATFSTNEFNLSDGLSKFGSAALRMSPLLILAFGALFRTPPEAPPLVSDARVLGIIGLLVVGPLSVLSSCKVGAAVNYYFSFSLLVALLASCGLRGNLFPLLGLSSAAALQLLLLTGRWGTIDLKPQARQVAERWETFRQLPEPRFSADARLQQPWLNRESPPFVLAYNYRLNLSLGRGFEAGGIGGLIESGFFAAMMLPADTRDKFQRGDLGRYQRSGEVAAMAVYLRQRPEIPLVPALGLKHPEVP